MLEIRAIVDRYRIDAFVDQGQSSDVYKVTHCWLHTPMILKHLRDDAPPELRVLLLEEGRVQCGQSHQNLVQVHDALLVEGRPALVMEFVDGPDLADWIDEREQPPLDEALQLFRGVVEGMAEAHRRGLVHRDLKPENILLERRRDGHYVPKVGDFGLAKLLKKGRGRNSLSTVYRLIGTPEYMAPEQIRDPSLVDRRSDIFSLGAILYELSTGQVAFDSEEVMQVLDRVSTGDFAAPKEIRGSIPDRLEALILSMLELDPRKRPQTCEEVLEALDAVEREWKPAR